MRTGVSLEAPLAAQEPNTSPDPSRERFWCDNQSESPDLVPGTQLGKALASRRQLQTMSGRAKAKNATKSSPANVSELFEALRELKAETAAVAKAYWPAQNRGALR